MMLSDVLNESSMCEESEENQIPTNTSYEHAFFAEGLTFSALILF